MFLSLRTRLVLAYFLFALLAVGIVTLGLGRAATLHLKDATGTHLQELAYEMSDRLDRGMFERHKDMQVLAQLDLMRDPTVGDDQRQLLVEELQRTFTPYAWIGYVTPDGEVRASTGSLLEGANVSSREWFRRARQSAFVGDVHDAVLLAKLLPHEGSEPLRFVDVSTPVRDRQGRLVAVLGAHLSWSWAREVQQGLLQPVHERRVDVLVLSRDHTVLLGPAELQGRKLALDVLSRPGLLAHEVERWPDGTSYVTGVSVSQGYRDYPGLGWTVVTREPAADAFAVVYGFQRAALVAAFLVALAFGVLGAWRAHAITLPLARLTRAAQSIRAGEPGVEVPTSDAYREVHHLSLALRDLVTTLEARVEERTQALSASTRRAGALAELAQIATLSLPPEKMAARAAAILVDLCRFQWAGLASVDGDGAHHRTVYLAPDVADLMHGDARVPLGQGLVWAALERRQALFVDDYPSQVLAVPRFVEWGASGAAFVPINSHTAHPHVLIFSRRERGEWTADERRLMTAAADVLSIAFERRAHEAFLERAALEDQLTGLRNRRAFDLDLDAALSGARRHDHPVAVVMIDLDGLKRVNDEEGHERGDALLREFALALGSAFRGNDRAYRLGGDEYALLLTHAAQEHVGALLRRVRHAEGLTRAAGFPRAGASAGVAFFPEDAASGPDVVRLADERMYADKADRRALAATLEAAQ